MRIYVKMGIAMSPIGLRVAVVGNAFRTSSFPPLIASIFRHRSALVSLNSRRNEIAKAVSYRRMDIKNRRNRPNWPPFCNKAPRQCSLVQSKLFRPTKLDTSLLGRSASCAGTLPDQTAFKLCDSGKNRYVHFSSVICPISPWFSE